MALGAPFSNPPPPLNLWGLQGPSPPPKVKFSPALGAFSFFFSAMCAILFFNSKRLIAFSTCSHIALMFLGFGTSFLSPFSDNGLPSIFHLFNHGSDKSLTFLLAGLLFHLFQRQHLRLIGSPFSSSPTLLSLADLGPTPLALTHNGLPYPGVVVVVVGNLPTLKF